MNTKVYLRKIPSHATTFLGSGGWKIPFKAKTCFLILWLLVALSGIGIAQTGILSGTVTNEAGETLGGVTVTLTGTTGVWKTNNDGYYEVKAAESAKAITFSSVGYLLQEIPLTGQSVINVVLQNETTDLDEVVVVGYGTSKRKDLTGAIGSFSAEDFNKTPQTNIGQALQGKIAGVGVSVPNSSVEDGGVSIQIRGERSITASGAPLVVLDGIPYSGVGGLAEISPNDIQSIDVLKDASAAAIYGARASNGVILITTKKGRTGKPIIKFDSFYGIDYIAKEAEYFDGEEYYKYAVERFGEGIITAEMQENYDAKRFTDWQRIGTQTGGRQQYNLSVSGGSEAVNYYVSATYGDTKGITLGDKIGKGNLRFNIEGKIADWITFGTNTQLGRYDRSGVPIDYDYSSSTGSFVPLLSAYNEDGSIKMFPMAGSTTTNLLDPLLYDNNDITSSINTNNYLLIDIPFVSGLSYKLNTGYTDRGRLTEQYQPSTSGRGYPVNGRSNVSNRRYEDWILENIVSYNRSFDDHHIDFTGLYSIQQTTSIEHALTAQDFPSDIQSVYQARNASLWTPTDSYTKSSFISYMARVNYNYKSRYLLTATIRRDGFSGFGAATKFGNFPSIALGWNFTDEWFMEPVEWLSHGKLRLSYGLNGNQAIGAYSTLPSLSTIYYLTTDKSSAVGYYPQRLGDPSLGWESTQTFNAGLDFTLFNDRIATTIDVFTGHTTDLLLDKNISSINGTNSIRQNIGSVKNVGYDISISSTNIRKRDFTWTTGLNVAFAKDRIIDVGLYDDQGNPIDDVGNRWFVGEPIRIHYGYKFDHILQMGEVPPPSQPNALPGWILVHDLDDNNAINADDMTILGSRIPRYYAGLANSLSYKNFSLTFFFNAQFGKIAGGDGNFWNSNANTTRKEFWTPETPNVVFPLNADADGYVGVSIYDKRNNADFVRLQDVTLSYKFPAIFKRVGVDQLEVYGNVKNAFTMTNWAWGPDPEFSSQITYPSLRSVLFGLRLTL